MGKRSDFPRVPQDRYDTPAPAAAPLLRHLRPRTNFLEPCCGPGRLVEHLERAGHTCGGAYDLPVDARSHFYGVERGVVIITNPPWARDVMHAIIANLSDQAPTWLLLPGDWLFNVSSAPLMPRLRRVVAIGRVRWIADSPHTSKDNCMWALFDPFAARRDTVFIGREAKK
jgi:hypothetical protein